MQNVYNQKFQERISRLKNTPVEKMVCILAVPTIISMLIGALYSLADTFFVSRLGSLQTAAVGLVFPIVALIQGIGFLFGMGAGSYMARLLGAEDNEKAGQVLSVAFFISLITGFLLSIIGIFNIDRVLDCIGVSENVFPYAKEFLFYIFLACPFFITSFTLNITLRFQGSAFYAMIGIVIGTVFNFILNPLFIFTFDMGIKGSAIATGMGQIISFCILLYFCGKDGNLGIKLSLFKPTKHILKIIFKDGQASIYRQGLASFAIILLNVMTKPYGDEAIASMSITTRIIYLLLALTFGFAQGFQPVCGFHYGEKRNDLVLKAFYFCLKISTLILTIFCALLYINAENMMHLFKMNSTITHIGVITLHLQSLTFMLNGATIFINLLAQTIGKAVDASIIAFSRQGFFFIPLILALPHFYGLYGVQMAQPIANILAFLLSIVIFTKIKNQLNQKLVK